MILLSNMHTHTTYCDGALPPKAMIDRAVELGFVSIGFSAHSPLPYKNSYAMLPENQDKYINEINNLKNEYADKIEVILGIELDLDSEINKDDYAFAIGSVHQIHGGGKIFPVDYNKRELINCIETLFSGDGLLMAEHYYNLVEKCLTRKEVSIAGHYDLISKFNDDGSIFCADNVRYREIATKALNRICKIRPELIFEINTGAMYGRGNKNPYPAPFLISLLGMNNMKIIINSDAHDSAGMDFGFNKALNLCKDCGIRSVYRLRDRGLEELKIV